MAYQPNRHQSSSSSYHQSSSSHHQGSSSHHQGSSSSSRHPGSSSQHQSSSSANHRSSSSHQRPSGSMHSSSSYRPYPSQQPKIIPVQRKPEVRAADFVCKPKFGNTLPDIPFGGKFLPCPFVPLSRFVQYKKTKLMEKFKYDVQCEWDMGVKIDLIDPETYYAVNPEATLNPKDKVLLEDDFNNTLNSKRSAQHARVVPFMRKTEYISSEFNRFGKSADRQEIKVGYQLKKTLDKSELNIFRSRQHQIDAINKTFEDIKKPVRRHYTKPGVTAVEEMPVFPDFELWKYPFAQVNFDNDPSVHTAPENMRKAMAEQAQIKGMADDAGEQFVGYFAPTVETLQKYLVDKESGRQFDEDQSYEYMMYREYNWFVRNKASKGFEQENFFFYVKDGCYYFNELETTVKLTRRRKPGQPKPNSKLMITYTDPTEDELAVMTKRMDNLLRPYDQEEEEEEEAEAEKEAEGSKKSSSSSSSSDSSEIDSDDEKGDAAKKIKKEQKKAEKEKKKKTPTPVSSSSSSSESEASSESSN